MRIYGHDYRGQAHKFVTANPILAKPLDSNQGLRTQIRVTD